ncbi:alpha/beta hydrolase [Nitrosomonas sp. Nm34]|uniref:alpha/beta hydrolase n=1 Tax=Nitrosomonas sp. Nm34 TaxID=1881055 RepID=UPI0008F0180E|nr:alpha/beta fold hydrolase [Nitrosomonas sp. Nm34]SFI63883.1 Esterase/lipase [Nitrosomonas sp. Nm34]
MLHIVHAPAFIALIILIVICGIAVIAIGIMAGGELCRPAQRSVGSPPADLPVETFTLQSPPNETSELVVSGWLIRGAPGMGVVLLLHGLRNDRRQMLDRVRFLVRAGYSVMLIDLPAHGESSGEYITFGYREAEGVEAAMRNLVESFPHEKIAVIGVSLGAASLVLSKASPAPSAVVLESMYPTIEEAIARRLQKRLGPLGSLLTPLFLWQLPIRLGVTADRLRPITNLAALHSPVFIMSGSEDLHPTVAETQCLFESANSPKELWIVEGAAHINLHAHNPKEYEARVSAFLQKYLRDGG